MAVLALAILPLSPEGTKTIVIGLSGEPNSPALAVGGLAIGVHRGGGTVGAAVGAVVLIGVGMSSFLGTR